MNAELKKSLVELIDESLAELEDLKKSARFSAAEISLGEDKSGIPALKDKNGSIEKEEDKKKDKDEEEEELEEEAKEEEDEEEDKKKDKDMKKEEHSGSDGQNRLADPKSSDKEKEMKKGESGMPEGTAAEGAGVQSSSEGTNEQASSSLKKAQEEIQELRKSYDERLSKIEDLIKGLTDAVSELASAPMEPRGATYKDISPLKKSTEDSVESLNKSEVLNKLFELKKSGNDVQTADIAAVEVGDMSAVSSIVQKYNLK